MTNNTWSLYLRSFLTEDETVTTPIPLPRTVVGSRSAMGALRKAPLNSWVQEWGQGKLTKELVSKHKPGSRTGVTRLEGRLPSSRDHKYRHVEARKNQKSRCLYTVQERMKRHEAAERQAGAHLGLTRGLQPYQDLGLLG